MVRFSAYAVGTVPMRINMIRPIPFWPSFEPCAKLTPVQVKIRTIRIHQGGGRSPSGAAYSAGMRSSSLDSSSRPPARKKPIKGENTSASAVSATLDQFTPSPNAVAGLISEFIKPTPTIEPIRLCELDAGSPRYQVPRFQTIADSSSENTIAKPAPDPTLSTSSTGSSATMPNATAPLEVSTPIRFHVPDQTTATEGRSDLV